MTPINVQAICITAQWSRRRTVCEAVITLIITDSMSQRATLRISISMFSSSLFYPYSSNQLVCNALDACIITLIIMSLFPSMARVRESIFRHWPYRFARASCFHDIDCREAALSLRCDAGNERA
ncbi:hypothetical protein LSAT2_015920 [Lamellibrachia satsuma]|nr:hypothetical protein LSAT2_015920 [Lamellibrachia satsuma]